MSIAWWKKETKTCQSKKHRIETYYDATKTKTSQTKKRGKKLRTKFIPGFNVDEQSL